MALGLLGIGTAAGCKDDKNPLAGLVTQLAKAAKTQDKAAITAMVDGETRIKLDTVRLILKIPKEKRKDAFSEIEPILKNPTTQIAKVDGEIADRVLTKHGADLATGKCVLGTPEAEDQDAVLFPSLPEGADTWASPELGRFIFELKDSVANSMAVRVQCGESKKFFVHAFQKKAKAGEGVPPWKILAVSE